MFNLITMIITVLILVGAAVAGYFYFGPSMDEGQGYKDLATYATQTLQVDGAYRAYLFDHDGTEPPGTGDEKVEGLVNGGYLANAPEGHWTFLQGHVYQDITVDPMSCRRINKAAIKDISSAAQYDGCPPCDDDAFKAYPGCTRDPSTDTPVASN